MSISKQTFFKQDAYINGQWVAATDGSSVAVTTLLAVRRLAMSLA